MSQKRYRVELTTEERSQLGKIIHADRMAAHKRHHAQMLLKLDEGPGGPGWRDAQVAEAVDLSPLVINEVTLIGSRCGPFAEAIQILAAEQVVVNGLITSRFDLPDGVKALEKAKESDQIKVLLCNKDATS